MSDTKTILEGIARDISDESIEISRALVRIADAVHPGAHRRGEPSIADLLSSLEDTVDRNGAGIIAAIDRLTKAVKCLDVQAEPRCEPTVYREATE